MYAQLVLLHLELLMNSKVGPTMALMIVVTEPSV